MRAKKNADYDNDGLGLDFGSGRDRGNVDKLPRLDFGVERCSRFEWEEKRREGEGKKKTNM